MSPVTFTLHQPDLNPQAFAPTHVYIEIKIQGKDIPFIVDTGDSKGTLRLSAETMEMLHGQRTSAHRRSRSIYGSANNDEFILSGIEIGDQILNDLRCEVSDDSCFYPWNTTQESMGIIGWGLLKEYNLLFDYAENQLTLYPRSEIPEEVKQWSQSRIYQNKGIISLKVQLEHQSIKKQFILDSGAGVYKVSDSGAPVYLDALFSREYTRLASHAENRRDDEKNAYLVTDMETGDSRLPSIKLGSLEVPWFLSWKYSGFLGWNFFRQYRLFFDNEKGILYYQPHADI